MTASPSRQDACQVAMGVRPVRFGVFVPMDPNPDAWRAFCLSAISEQSRFWGGSNNLLFPMTDDFENNELFWALASIHDADRYIVHRPIVRDLDLVRPG